MLQVAGCKVAGYRLPVAYPLRACTTPKIHLLGPGAIRLELRLPVSRKAAVKGKKAVQPVGAGALEG